MTIEMGGIPSKALLRKQLNNTPEEEKLDYIKAEKNKINSHYTIYTTEAMLFLNTRQIFIEKPGTDTLACYIEANIEEAVRIGSKLRRLQPKDTIGTPLRLAKSTHIEIKELKFIKKQLAKEIAESRARASKIPNLSERFDSELIKKLHLQPRK